MEIEELEDRISDLQSLVDRQVDEITDLEVRVREQEDEISELKEENAMFRTNIQAVIKELESCL